MKNILKALSLIFGSRLLESLLRAHPDIAYVTIVHAKDLPLTFSEEEICG